MNPQNCLMFMDYNDVFLINYISTFYILKHSKKIGNKNKKCETMILEISLECDFMNGNIIMS